LHWRTSPVARFASLVLKASSTLLGVGFRQFVLFTQALVRPHCRVVTGAKLVDFGDQSIA